MIKQVSLLNFQSHVDTKIDFHEGVNAIIGETDQGKTAILRGINLVATNLPKDKPLLSFLSNQAETNELSVSIATSEGIRVTRKRSDSENVYVLKTPEGEESFIAGTGVPEEVINALNLHPQINIQNQMDSPFLLMQSPGDAGRLVNQLVRLEVIDKTLSKVRSIKREEKKEKKRLSGEIEKDEAEATKLKQVVDQVASVHDLEEDVDLLDETWMSIDNLEESIEEYERDSARIPALQKIASLHGEAVEVESLLKKSEEIFVVVQDLAYNIERYENNKGIMEEEQRVLDEVDFGSVSKQIKEWKEANDLVEDLKVAVKANDVYEAWRISYERDKARFDEMMPEVCPLCGRPL